MRDEENGRVEVEIAQDSDGTYRIGRPSSATVTVEDDDKPPTPTNLRANGRIVSGGNVTLRWDIVPTAVGYEIDYAEVHCKTYPVTGFGCYSQSATVISNVSPHSDFITNDITGNRVETTITLRATGWQDSYGSTGPLFVVSVRARDQNEESDWSHALVAAYPAYSGTDTVATIPFNDETARANGRYDYWLCEDSVPPRLYFPPSRSKSSVINDIRVATGTWEQHVRWDTGSGNIIDVNMVGEKTHCDIPAMSSLGNQLMFVRLDQMVDIPSCETARACYRYDSIMVLDDPTVYEYPLHLDWYDRIRMECVFLQSIVAHEVGHALGLGHSRWTESIMRANATTCNPLYTDIGAMMARYQSR